MTQIKLAGTMYSSWVDPAWPSTVKPQCNKVKKGLRNMVVVMRLENVE